MKIFITVLVLALGCGKKESQSNPPTKQTSGPVKKTPASKPEAKINKDERLLWEFKTGAAVYSSPAISSDGTVYVGSVDKKLHALNGKSGVNLWEFETEDDVYSSPAIGSDGTLYVGSEDDKKLYAIKTESLGLAKSPWPMRGQNAQHTGRAPAK